MTELTRPPGTIPGRIKVMITSFDETRIKACFLNRFDTVTEAKKQWAREWNCDIDSFVFTVGTVALSDDTPFTAIPFSSPGIVELYVDEKVPLPVRLFGWKEEEPRRLSAALSTLAQDLYDCARGLFGLPEGRAVRFRCGATIVAGGQSLREAGVTPSSGLLLELGWRVSLRRAGCAEAEVTLFQSELLARIASSQFRLRSGALTTSEVAAAEALLQDDLHGSGTAQLALEAVCEVAVLRDGAVEAQRAWPEGGVSGSWPNELMLRRQVAPCGCGFLAALPPQPSGVLLHESLRVVGVLPGARRAVLRVPRDGSVADLLAAAAAVFEGPRVRLQAMLGGRALPQNASLRAVGVRDRQEVKLQRLSTEIHVRFGPRQLVWALPVDREEVTFGEIAAGVSTGLRARRQVLLSGVLQCEGCGRKLSLERQHVQRVPAACCELRSMQLCYAAKGRRATGMQTEPYAKNTEMQTKANSNTDAETQTEPLTNTPEWPNKAGPAGEIEVRLRLPGDHVTLHRLVPHDSLNALIDALRHSGQLLRPDDVILRGRSLMKVPRGRRLTLWESGVRDGDELLVTAFLPLALKVFVPSMKKTFFLSLDRGGNCWDGIKDKLSLPAGRDVNVVAQERLFYRRCNEWRSAGNHYLNGRYTYLDEEDGEEVRPNSLLVREFFAPEVGFKAAPRGVPRIWVFDGVLGYEKKRLVTLEPRFFFNPAYVACVEGIQCFSNEDMSKKLFIQTGDAGFFECSSNTVFKDSDEIQSSVLFKKLTMRWIYLLFRENDTVPRWSLPRDKLVLVFRRHGVDLEIINNRLCRKDPSYLCISDSCWTCPCKPDAFQEEFSKCVRRKRHQNSL